MYNGYTKKSMSFKTNSIVFVSTGIKFLNIKWRMNFSEKLEDTVKQNGVWEHVF